MPQASLVWLWSDRSTLREQLGNSRSQQPQATSENAYVDMGFPQETIQLRSQPTENRNAYLALTILVGNGLSTRRAPSCKDLSLSH